MVLARRKLVLELKAAETRVFGEPLLRFRLVLMRHDPR